MFKQFIQEVLENLKLLRFKRRWHHFQMQRIQRRHPKQSEMEYKQEEIKLWEKHQGKLIRFFSKFLNPDTLP